MGSDADAAPALLDAMAAAHRHDPDAFHSALDTAYDKLGPRRTQHAAATTISRARELADEGQWRAAWSACYQGLVDLVWTFPPDISTCPPPPGETAGSTPAPKCPDCGAVSRAATARFCSMCGTAVTVS